ncbi:MAG: hypothetical protein V4635_13145 [Bacteroidota bacterium]
MKRVFLNDKIYIKVKKNDRLQKNMRFIAVLTASGLIATRVRPLRLFTVYRQPFTVHRLPGKVNLIAVAGGLFTAYLYKKFNTNGY